MDEKTIKILLKILSNYAENVEKFSFGYNVEQAAYRCGIWDAMDLIEEMSGVDEDECEQE